MQPKNGIGIIDNICTVPDLVFNLSYGIGSWNGIVYGKI